MAGILGGIGAFFADHPPRPRPEKRRLRTGQNTHLEELGLLRWSCSRSSDAHFHYFGWPDSRTSARWLARS